MSGGPRREEQSSITALLDSAAETQALRPLDKQSIALRGEPAMQDERAVIARAILPVCTVGAATTDNF
jgi:hypothetical protein